MGNLKGVDIQRGTIGASTLNNSDGISGLLANSPAIVAKTGVIGLAVGTTISVKKLKEAEAYGITAAYDSTNNVRVHRHISEFFRMAGEGNTLHVMLYAGTIDDALTTADYAKKMLIDAKGTIRQLAVAWNPAADYAATYTDGIDAFIKDAIFSAQDLYDWANGKQMPCQILLEGRDFNAVSAAAALDLRAIDADGVIVEAHKVSLCIGQDYSYAGTQNAIGKKMADVGTLLGSVAGLKANHNNHYKSISYSV